MNTNVLGLVLNQVARVTDGLEGLYTPHQDLENEVNGFSLRVVLISAGLLLGLIVFAALIKDRIPKLKLPLFVSMVFLLVASTATLVGSTIYLNMKSDSKGPIHWHADVEIWACGNELELIDPTGFSNKVGTSTLHEHDDRRIHLEGVAVDKENDASLGKFMYVVDGAITSNAMIVPLNPTGSYFENEFDGDGKPNLGDKQLDKYLVNEQVDGKNKRYARFINGEKCGDVEAEVQTFVYKYEEKSKTYEQTKLSDPSMYVITPDGTVPPGDCVIFEFDAPKKKTDKLCEQFGIRDQERCKEFGVTPDKEKICELKQVNYQKSDSDPESVRKTLPRIKDPTPQGDVELP